MRYSYLIILLFALAACSDQTSVSPFSSGEPIAYCAQGTKIFRMKPEPRGVKGIKLPNKLLLKPGLYEIDGSSYNFSIQGLCRIVIPEKQNHQRIIFDGDVNALMSAIAWMTTHGNLDDALSLDEKYDRALTSKLILTCGAITLFAEEILARENIRSRPVLSLTLDPWNSYDNGHTMIEVLMEKGWELYDLDNNVRIENLSGTGATFLEFVDAVQAHQYKAVKIANDTTADVSLFRSQAGFNYGFYSELINSDTHNWYKRVIQVPLIQGEDKEFYFFDRANKEKIESYSANLRYMNHEAFLNRFY